jgi:hypothetical protein
VPDFVIGPAVVVLLIGLVLVGARRQRTGHPIWSWLAHLHLLLPPAALIVLSISLLLDGNNVVGLVLLALGLALGISVVTYVRTVSSQLRIAPPGELSQGAVDAMADFALKRMGILLLGGVILGVLAVIWAILGGFN